MVMLRRRLEKIQRQSPENLTHKISQQDCLVLMQFEPCSPETCLCGCWMTEEEYKQRVKSAEPWEW